jgi:hypothetical protein
MNCVICGTVNSTSDNTLWTLFRSCFKGISANIELLAYSVTCCCVYVITIHLFFSSKLVFHLPSIFNFIAYELRICRHGISRHGISRHGVVAGILVHNARGRGFDSRTVQIFVCMNMSVCIESGCFYV